MSWINVKQVVYNVQMSLQYIADGLIDIVFYPVFGLLTIAENIYSQMHVRPQPADQEQEDQGPSVQQFAGVEEPDAMPDYPIGFRHAQPYGKEVE